MTSSRKERKERIIKKIWFKESATKLRMNFYIGILSQLKLESSVINRPHINISIGTSKKPLITPVLVDTGASISVLSEDLARCLFQRQGLPYLLMQTATCVTSATGHGLLIKGQLETKVSGIGVVSFYVVRNLLNHHCIIGWDLLNLYGVDLTSTELTWGGKTFRLSRIPSPKYPQ